MSTSSTTSVSDSGSPTKTHSDAEFETALQSRSKGNHDATSKAASLLSDDPFSSEVSQRLFDAIDELRRYGAGQDLDLPQLVIAGKQSAGKSSLLKSLTDIPFPAEGGGACTRFATRIISRRTAPGSTDLVHVSIEPGDIDVFGEGDDGQTENFNQSIPALTAEAFCDIIKQAAKCMGTPTEDSLGSRNFSSKVLKIEISGPTRSHFGILDVPGIFSATNQKISVKEKDGVTEIVTGYMKKKSNIIICVADATDDMSNQTIFDLASEYCDKSRIVGVFTKCDITQHPEQVVKIATGNQDIPLEHGWFVVQNDGPKGSRSLDRKQDDGRMFGKAPWNEIPAQYRGKAMLKKFLANLLCRRIRESFPTMQRTIGKLLEAERYRFSKLGKPRESLSDCQNHLFKIAERVQQLSHQALNSPEELPSDAMKLRGLVKKARDEFIREIEKKGHFYEFSVIEESSDVTKVQDGGKKISPDTRAKHNSQKADALYNEIRNQIGTNYGDELPCMTNPKVLKPLFRKQTSKWEQIGKNYLGKVVSMTSDVVARILAEVCTELQVKGQTESELGDMIYNLRTAKEKEIIHKLETYFKEVSTFPLQITKQLFTQKVQEAKNLRFRAALERYLKNNPPEKFLYRCGATASDRSHLETLRPIFGSWAIVDTNNLAELFEQMDPRGGQNTEDEIHDLLKAYYEITRDEYVTFVTRSIVENFLYDEQGPLLGLRRNFISDLNEEVVHRLGGEDDAITTNRKQTEVKVMRLEQSLKIADKALKVRDSTL